jgi:DNA-binding response OmpR family regulator
VDDEPVIRRIAELALTGAGHTVSEAGDAASALAMIRAATRPFDLVLLDRTLPDGEGIEMIPAIRQLAPATRILVVSGLGEMDAASVGADGFLPKPFTRSSLSAAVRAVTGQD